MEHPSTTENTELNSVRPAAVKPPGPVLVSDPPKRNPKTKPKKPVQEPKNVFSDETALFLLRLLKGKNYRPKTLPEHITLSPSKDVTPANSSRITLSSSLQEELAAVIREKLTPVLWSFFVHFLLLVILALIFLPKIKNSPFEILGGIGEEFLEFKQDLNLGFDAEPNDPLVIVPQNLPPVENPVAATPMDKPAENGNEPAVSNENVPPGLSFGSRVGSHTNSLSSGGGTGKTDESVVAGLRWLMRVQNPDGGWRLGTARNPVPKERENRNAATAMALLAFQGYGVVPNSPQPQLKEFSKSVQRGWDFLLRQQHTDGCFFRDDGLIKTAFYEHRFYTHGLCTMALCELLAMTGEEQLREPAIKAVQYCTKHQSVSGGWRYRPDRFSTESDISVTGWILMALKTAQAAGIEVPREVFTKIDKFLDSMGRHNETQYIYREEEPELRLSMTAEALFCRELLGWKYDDPRLKQGIAILVQPENLPVFDQHYKRDAYCWYYAAQALHHYGGKPWETWNGTIRELLPAQQEKTGADAGSWNPDTPVRDTWGTHYGRLYTTCLSIYILETYYRHGRIYR